MDRHWPAGQDETTVRSRDDMEAVGLWPEAGFVLAAEFRLRDGTVRSGAIVTDRGQVGFWRGALKPAPAELAEAYALLSRPPKAVFPIRYRSRLWVGHDFLKGTIRGFSYLDKAEGIVDVR